MNRHEASSSGEARIRYLDGDFQVVAPGGFVTCAVTGAAIALSDLRYWSVERQEAYANASASLEREHSARNKNSR